MELQTLKVMTREVGGKSGARAVRVTGELPCVLYGGEAGAISLKLNAHEFEQMIAHNRSGEHALVNLEVSDNPTLSTPALLKTIQHHPIRGHAIHADFLRIRLDVKITTTVPVKLVGQAPGISEGGVLDCQCREVEVECLALDVPDHIVCDVSSLHLNQSIHVSELKTNERVMILTEGDRPVAAVLAPRVAKDEEEAEGGEAAAEPVVLTERKKEEAAPAPKKK